MIVDHEIGAPERNAAGQTECAARDSNPEPAD